MYVLLLCAQEFVYPIRVQYNDNNIIHKILLSSNVYVTKTETQFIL